MLCLSAENDMFSEYRYILLTWHHNTWLVMNRAGEVTGKESNK